MIQVLRFTRVVFGISSSPFLLNATIKKHLEQYTEKDPELIEKLLNSIYVDDTICGSHEEEGAYQIYLQAKAILKKGGFNLRKFISNSTELLQARIDQREGVRDLILEEDTYAQSIEHKVLGVLWNVK